jgi:hypothetical protein
VNKTSESSQPSLGTHTTVATLTGGSLWMAIDYLISIALGGQSLPYYSTPPDVSLESTTVIRRASVTQAIPVIRRVRC